MPAPLVTAAIKIGAQQIQQKFPGGLVGAGLTVLILPIISSTIMISFLMSTMLSGVVAATGQDDCGGTSQTSLPSAIPGIPQVALEAYAKAGQATGIDWVYLAALGKIESGHGSANGATLGTNGVAAPMIKTPPLNGSGFGGNTVGMPYSGPGNIDGWDHGIGPMQFLLSTWYGGAGKDGNGDGKKDPNNIFDAALASGYYLKAHGAPSDMDAAIFAYNRSSAYVASVKSAAQEYKTAAGSSGASASVVNASNPAASSAPAASSGASGQFTQPIDANDYTLGGGFADVKGVKFLTSGGKRVGAVADGVVKSMARTTEGLAITVDHGKVNGSVTRSTYSPVVDVAIASGQKVKAGDALGKTTSSGLLLQVSVDGRAVDPATYLMLAGSGVGSAEGSCGGYQYSGTTPSGGGAVAWGGYSNGKIPLSALCPISYSPVADHLRCDAAKAYEAMNLAYKSRFGGNLCLTDSYRPYSEQVAVYATSRPGYAAKPGSSRHGWAVAVDLCGGIQSFGSPQYAWMKANAGQFGWFHPSWAEPSGVTPEPWHWEFGQQR